VERGHHAKGRKRRDKFPGLRPGSSVVREGFWGWVVRLAALFLGGEI